MTVSPRFAGIKFRDVLIALSLIAIAAALKILAPERTELAPRVLGVMSGLVVVFYANAIPKTLTPLAKLQDPARHESLQRFVGWCLVLGGLGYALAWIAVPFDFVVPVAIVLLGSSLAVALGRCFWLRRLA